MVIRCLNDRFLAGEAETLIACLSHPLHIENLGEI